MNDSESPVLIPPSDATMRRRLELKLDEYETRKQGKDKPWEYAHPKAKMALYPGYRDAFYKVEVLTAVLKTKEPLKTHDLYVELANKLADNVLLIDEKDFNNACATIEMYLVDGDQMGIFAKGGTGLPKVAEIPTTAGDR